MDVVRVSVRELLHHSREVLARVEQGDRLQITRRGRVVAVLAPPAPDEVAMDQLVAAGEIDPDWRDRQAELRRTLDRLPARSAAPGSSAGTDALIANRDER
jgi:prevent-host-death family protein